MDRHVSSPPAARRSFLDLAFMVAFGALGWALLGFWIARDPGSFNPPGALLPEILFVVVIIATRGMATEILPRTVVTLDSAFYVAAAATLGPLTAGVLVAVALTVDSVLRLRRSGRPEVDAPRGRVRSLAYVFYFGGMTGAMLVAIGRAFHVGGEFTETSHGAVLASVMSMGLALLLAHYAVQGVRQVLAGRELRLYIRRLAVPGMLAEASLLPLAVVFVLVYSPVEHIGMALLGATFLLINFVFARLLRAQRTLRQRVTELETLDTTARALSQSLQSSSLIEPVARETLRAIPEADCLSLVLRDREGGLVVDTYHRGGAAPVRTRQAAPDRHQRLVLERQQSVSEPEGRAWLGVPVVMYGEVDGVLAIDSAEPGAFGPDQQRLLESISAQVAVALQNAHLYKLAMVDGLTGLFVRRYFDVHLDEEVKRADRFGTSFSVVMMDIDDFKVINDTYGHPLGDRALRDIARAVRDQMRGVDTAARYGGEEIAMILPRTEMLDAYNQAERIRADIEALRLDHEGELLSVTASFGIAAYPDSGAGSPVDLVRRADRALYRAKKTGKNRVELYWNDGDESPGRSSLRTA